MQSLLLSFTEYLYDMKGSLITSMENSNVCIHLRQCLKKNISHLIVTHGLFFSPVSICLFAWQQAFKRNLKLNWNHLVTHGRQKSIKEKSTTTLRRKEKQKKFIMTKWITRIERIGSFTRQELKKNVKEKSAHITFQTRLWCKECLLIHLEGLKNTSLWIWVVNWKH